MGAEVGLPKALSLKLRRLGAAGLSTGAIVGIVIGVLVAVGAVGAWLMWQSGSASSGLTEAKLLAFYEAWGVTSTRSEHVPALVRDYQNNVESLNAQLRDKYHGTDLRSSVADIQAKRKKFASAMELSTPPQQIAYGTPPHSSPPPRSHTAPWCSPASFDPGPHGAARSSGTPG